MASQGFQIRSDQWRWAIAAGWALAGVALLVLWAWWGQGKSDTMYIAVLGSSLVFTGIVRWWYWKFEIMPLGLRRLLYGFLLFPTAILIMRWGAIEGAAWTELSALGVAMAMAILIHRYVRHDGYAHYFAAVIGMFFLTNIVSDYWLWEWSAFGYWFPTIGQALNAVAYGGLCYVLLAHHRHEAARPRWKEWNIVPDRWRWLYVAGWAVLGLWFLGVWFEWPLAAGLWPRADAWLALVFGLACILTAVVRWRYWRQRTLHPTLRRLLYVALLLPMAVLTLWSVAFGALPIWVQLVSLAILFMMAMHSDRFASLDAYAYYFASFLGLFFLGYVVWWAQRPWDWMLESWPTLLAVIYWLTFFAPRSPAKRR